MLHKENFIKCIWFVSGREVNKKPLGNNHSIDQKIQLEYVILTSQMYYFNGVRLK